MRRFALSVRRGLRALDGTARERHLRVLGIAVVLALTSVGCGDGPTAPAATVNFQDSP